MNYLILTEKYKRIFFDTAPIIYIVDNHPDFGEIAKLILENLNSKNGRALTSVLTLMEALPLPVKLGNEEQVTRFVKYLKSPKNIELIDIVGDIA